jgi:integrase
MKMARPATGQVIEDRRTGDTGYALRFRAYGKRWFVTLGRVSDGWTYAKAEQELAETLILVRRGLWHPPETEPVVEVPKDEPTFHQYSSDWHATRKTMGLEKRTIEYEEWALTCHLLPFFSRYRASQITRKLVDQYSQSKIAEREQLEVALARWEETEPAKRGARPSKGLANRTINQTVGVLAQILDDAIEDDDIPLAENPAHGKKRKLPAKKPRRIWLEEYDEIRSLLDAAGDHRALLATMILTGLRVSELCALRWRSVDLAKGNLTVEASKTEAGEGRTIDLTPLLREELTLHKAANPDADHDGLVFPTVRGTQRNRNNVRNRILLPTLDRANVARAKAGLPPIPHVTNHTLRRTFASVLYDAGATPTDVMAQMGHTSAALALEVYAKKMKRSSDTAKRMDENLEWAATGSKTPEGLIVLSSEETVGAAERLQ